MRAGFVARLYPLSAFCVGIFALRALWFYIEFQRLRRRSPAPTSELHPVFMLVGGDSEIGKATGAHLRRRYRALATTRRALGTGDDRIVLDLAAALAAWEPPAGVAAACICAAVARLGQCAADPIASARVNVAGTLALTERLAARGIYVLFLSTTQVFDGSIPNVPAAT